VSGPAVWHDPALKEGDPIVTVPMDWDGTQVCDCSQVAEKPHPLHPQTHQFTSGDWDYRTDGGATDGCTYQPADTDPCGKPEDDPIHPGPDGRMGGGRHVYRTDSR
jgi:hypothetical protein